MTMVQVAAMGALFVRALPVMLLTVVGFLNTYAWVLASTISRTRLWMVVLFLLFVTTAFIVSASHSRVRPMLEAVSAPHSAAHDLSATPFAAMPDSPVNDPLSTGERINVVVVLAAAQIAHLLVVAIRRHLLRPGPDRAQPGATGEMDRRRPKRRNHPRHDHPGAAVTDQHDADSVRTDLHVRQRALGG
ncbi:hypothetical protein [Mycobacterium sp.]|uniref:hypothetical protein n=1 Tax=Mycobacterium sp. TaxID=1785 RepID=UPI003340E35B